ncbi:putative 3-demethylubiquinone-9 3-methyltransferase (glyoxalase superfamily) [Metapseudomonas resinovorans]
MIDYRHPTHQEVPIAMIKMLEDSQSAGSQRAFAAMMQMKKLDIAVLKKAFDG